MNTLVAKRFRVFVFFLGCACLLFGAKPADSQGPPRVIGSSNPVTADPSVPRPHETPCVVQLFSGLQFADFNIKTFRFTPPAACPGPWKKIVLTADFNVTAGRQFDRTAIIDLGYVNIYFGTTPEPRHNLSPTWHFERDETDYSALFTGSQTGHVILGNVVNSTYNGVISGSAALEFYPAEREEGSRTADQVLALTQSNGNGGINEPAFLFTSTDQLATPLTLPGNIERAYLDVITQSQINDEFWYFCVPNDVANELLACGNTAFREAEISIDGQPAGVAPVYPWIYTGGVDPFLWEPVPGVETFNFVPYRVDLTPFAGVLSNGQPHTVALQVVNADSYFSATATLLLFLDHGTSQVSGQVTANTIGSGPAPTVNENLKTDASGNITGTITTTSAREFVVAGFVNTSHGRVDTEVHQSMNFINVQDFVIINGAAFTSGPNGQPATDTQNLSQQTEVRSATTTRQGWASSETREHFRYPLTLDYTLTLAADGSGTQVTTASQEFKHTLWSPFYADSVENTVHAADTLFLTPSFSITGNRGAESSERYHSFDTRGRVYSCELASKNNVLTSVSDGCSAAQH